MSEINNTVLPQPELGSDIVEVLRPDPSTLEYQKIHDEFSDALIRGMGVPRELLEPSYSAVVTAITDMVVGKPPETPKEEKIPFTETEKHLIKVHDTLVKLEPVDYDEKSEMYHLIESIKAQMQRLSR